MTKLVHLEVDKEAKVAHLEVEVDKGTETDDLEADQEGILEDIRIERESKFSGKSSIAICQLLYITLQFTLCRPSAAGPFDILSLTESACLIKYKH